MELFEKSGKGRLQAARARMCFLSGLGKTALLLALSCMLLVSTAAALGNGVVGNGAGAVAADFNGDGCVTLEDLGVLATHWCADPALDPNSPYCVPGNNNCGGSDLDGSGFVDFADFGQFAPWWLRCYFWLNSSVVGPNGGLVPEGLVPYLDDTVVTLTGLPDPNYRVAQWTDNGVPVDPCALPDPNDWDVYAVTMDTDHDVTVSFTERTGELLKTWIGAGSDHGRIVVDPNAPDGYYSQGTSGFDLYYEGHYLWGDEVTVTAYPNVFWMVDYWTDENGTPLQEGGDSFTFPVNGSRTVIVHLQVDVP